MKKLLGLRIDGRLKDAMDEKAARSGKAATALLEEYIQAGLARDNGELIEESSLPAIREAVRQVAREEVGKIITELIANLSADLAEAARKDTNRLAALIVKTTRYAGIGQRMVYALLAKTAGPDFASRAYEDAKEKTGRDIARPDQN